MCIYIYMYVQEVLADEGSQTKSEMSRIAGA